MQVVNITVNVPEGTDMDHMFEAVWGAMCLSTKVTQQETDFVLSLITKVDAELKLNKNPK
jgi:hypothetical protein